MNAGKRNQLREIDTAMRVSIIVTHSGGGHEASAKALINLLAQRFSFEPKQHDLYTDIIPNLDPAPYLFGVNTDEAYNKYCLKTPYGGVLATVLMQPIMTYGRLVHRSGVKAFKKFFEAEKPEVVISVSPHINHGAQEAAKALDIPFALLITDLFEAYPGFWLHKKGDYKALVPSPGLKRMHRKGRHERCVPITLPLVRAPFYEAPPEKTGEYKADHPHFLIVFGGHASTATIDIARELAALPLPVTADIVCGRADQVRQKIEALALPDRFKVHGFVEDIHHLFRKADFVLGKTGPGVISEALLSHAYPILLGGWWGLPQEHPNVRWLNKTGIGRAESSVPKLMRAVKKALASPPEINIEIPEAARKDQEIILDFFEEVMPSALKPGVAAVA